MRACARKGCKFAATWHPTHCCAACANTGAHGGRCERKVIESTPAETAAVHTQDATNDELEKAAKHLEEMGLGALDVILELLKANEGNVRSTLEILLAQPQ